MTAGREGRTASAASWPTAAGGWSAAGRGHRRRQAASASAHRTTGSDVLLSGMQHDQFSALAGWRSVLSSWLAMPV